MKIMTKIICGAIALVAGVMASAKASNVAAGLRAYNNGAYQEAAAIFMPLAEAGDVSAQNHLGYLYAQGHGVAQDYPRAYMWFNIAAAQGDVLAADNRDTVVVWMTPAQIRSGQAMSVSCVQKSFKKC